MPARPPHLLVVEARFYDHIADALLRGATAAIERSGGTFEVVTVPGALEIPGAVAMAVASGTRFDGYVALGCVIRGETTHYETVANESARALMDVTVTQRAPLGNGILTVENEEQALVRADPARGDKGGAAVRAALTMIAIRARFEK